VLTYKDLELDEISNLGTNTTPASFLTRSSISFLAKDVEITNFVEEEDYIAVSVMKKNRKEAGEFSLVFNKSPFDFIKMEVKNDLGEKTEITLENKDFNKVFDDKLFIVKNKNLPN
jgi:outer membrane lipoprotein-sorting protein